MPPSASFQGQPLITWHTLSADQVVSDLHGDRQQGLSQQQVAENLQVYGKKREIGRAHV